MKTLKKKIRALLKIVTAHVFLFMFSVAGVLFYTGTAEAATIYSNSSTGNDTLGDGSSGTPYLTFHKAYTQAADGDTINLIGTFTWTDVDETGDASPDGYTISKNLTIQGQGAGVTIIQAATSYGAANRGVFNISAGYTVTMNDVSIRYAYKTGGTNGGGIYNQGTLTVNRCDISNNYVYWPTQGGYGGGISNIGTLTVQDSTISNNFAQSQGGGIQNGYTAGNTNIAYITNSTIVFNSTADNLATVGGAGIFIRSGTAYITNSTIAYNDATDQNGDGSSTGDTSGIDIEGGMLYIKNSIVAYNEMNGTNITTISGNCFDVTKGSGSTLTDNGGNIFGKVNTAYGGVTFASTSWYDLYGNSTGDSVFTLYGMATTGSLYLDTVLADNSTLNGTQTLAITSASSIAVDSGLTGTNGSISVPSTDQRGLSRSGAVDIGAYEYGGFVSYTLTVTTAGTGTGTVTATGCTLSWTGNTGTCDVSSGATITLSGSAGIGSTWDGWSGGTGSVSCTGTDDCAFSITTDSGVIATFTLNQYTVTTTAVNGTITSTNNPTVDHGLTTTVTGSANANYYFTGVSGCSGTPQTNTDQSTSTFSYTTGEITSACTVTATFAIKNYTVTTSATNGSITSTNNPTVDHGLTTTITGSANANYYFTGVSGCSGTPQTNTDQSTSTFSYTTGEITSACTVTATFAIKNYTVTTSATNGSITSTNNPTVDHGLTTTVTGSANANYYFTGVSGCSGTPQTNTDQSTSTFSYTTGEITSACTVTATFAIKNYTVTTSATNGSITSTNNPTVDHGLTTTVTGSANANYYFTGVSGCNGTPQTNTDQSTSTFSYTTGEITSACTVTATFAIKNYTLTYTAGVNGSISGTSPQTVNHGANGSVVTAVPDTGYHFVDWSDALTANPRTDTNVTANISVTANFAANGSPSIPTLISPTTNSEGTALSPVLTVNSTDPEADPITYEFQVSVASNFSTIAAQASGVTPTGGNGVWTVNISLNDNTRYYWRARATDGTATSQWMTPANFFVNTANDAPTVPGISSPTNGAQVSSLAPTVTITNSTDVDIYDTVTYDFVVALDSGFTNTVASQVSTAQGGGGTTSYAPGTLSDDTAYYWRARAKDNHSGVSGWATATFFVSTANNAPTAPTLNTPGNASETTSTTPTLTVNNATDPDLDTLSYVFEVDTVNTFNSVNKQTSSSQAEGAGTTAWTPTALIDNTTWYWRAKANDGLADGTWMTTASFFVNTGNDAPTAPTVSNPGNSSTVTVLAPTLTVFAATDPDNDSMIYAFEVYSDSGLTSLVTSTSGVGVSWVADGLSDNTRYWWHVRATDVHGLSGPWMTTASFFVNNNGYNDPPTIRVTTPAAAGSIAYGNSYTIQWIASDPDSDPTIVLGYDTMGTGCSGTAIPTGALHVSDGSSYPWDITALPYGTYYVYAIINDGSVSICFYGPGAILRGDTNGDINFDGTVNTQDALMTLRIVVGLDTATQTLMSRGDVAPILNGVPQPDGKIDIGDVLVILRKTVGL